MARLLDDLLDRSRNTRNKLELWKQRVLGSVIIDSAVETSRPFIEAGGHDLTLHLPAEPLPQEAETVRLAQVSANLRNYAAKYMEKGSRIGLPVERVDTEVVATISSDELAVATDRSATVRKQAERRELLPPLGLLFICR
jgi:signal transduction histidine kinase